VIRNFLIMSGVVAMAATAAVAQGNGSGVDHSGNPYARGGPLDLGPTRYVYGAPPVSTLPPGLDAWKAGQLLRWGEDGKCVVARAEEASLAYVAAERGTPEAAVAAKRLDPAFTACLAGAGITSRNNKAYRRAAVADALGVRLSS
jgi:hypothetical protein